MCFLISLETVDRLTPMSLAMVLVECPAASANSMRERIEMSMCFLPFFIVFLLVGSVGIGGTAELYLISARQVKCDWLPPWGHMGG